MNTNMFKSAVVLYPNIIVADEYHKDNRSLLSKGQLQHN